MTSHTIHKHILFLLYIIFAVTAYCSPRTVADIPNVHLSDRTRYVSNPDNILSPKAEAQLNSILGNIWDKTSSEAVIVVVDEIEGDPDTFATELFQDWGIGKKDNSNGLLFLVSRKDRKTVIRTGYGMEGVIPDIIAGRIIRNISNPHYAQGDFDTGTLNAVQELSRIITTPGATEELLSKYKNDQGAGSSFGPDAGEILDIWIKLGTILAAALAIWLVITIRKNRKKTLFERYHALKLMTAPGAMVSLLGLGIPLPVFLIQLILLRRSRTKPRKCPNCSHKMKRLDEKADNAYLTPAQDTEEQLNSVDYDVWLCPQCGETDILPYVIKNSNYKVCPNCKARTLAYVGNRIISQPTQRSEGQGVRSFICRNCGKSLSVPYSIPRINEPPIVILPPGGGSGFGGGISGGSFGGGMTGGGGASGGW